MEDQVHEQDIKQALTRFCSQYIGSLVADPSFEFNVVDVEAVSRPSVDGAACEPGWMINIETNNRAQLHGQFPPYQPGDYRGLYTNLITGRAMQFLFSEFGRSEFVTLNVASTTDCSVENSAFTKLISVETALNEGLISKNSPLHEKLLQYNIEYVQLDGGSFISSPTLDMITAIEDVITEFNITSLFDCCCGIGTVSSVAAAHDVETLTALDLDTTGIKKTLPSIPDDTTLTIIEADMYEYNISNQYDLIVVDPYYSELPNFFTRCMPAYAEAADYMLLNLGYTTDSEWCERELDRISDQIHETHPLNTPRHYLCLIETLAD